MMLREDEDYQKDVGDPKAMDAIIQELQQHPDRFERLPSYKPHKCTKPVYWTCAHSDMCSCLSMHLLICYAACWATMCCSLSNGTDSLC